MHRERRKLAMIEPGVYEGWIMIDRKSGEPVTIGNEVRAEVYASRRTARRWQRRPYELLRRVTVTIHE